MPLLGLDPAAHLLDHGSRKKPDAQAVEKRLAVRVRCRVERVDHAVGELFLLLRAEIRHADRKSTRLNSSHTVIYTLSLHDALPISSRRKTPCGPRPMPS